MREIYTKWGFKDPLLGQVVKHIVSDKTRWCDLMMEQELKLYPPAENPVVTAAIVGISALIGSFVPLIPYMFFSVQGAILPALGLSAVVLFAVGAYKGKISLGNPIKSGLWLAGIGIAAALIGYGVGYALNVLV